MSFKDKPLKKIVADKRVTIDAIHSDIVKENILKKKEYEETQDKLKRLTSENNSDPEIKVLESKIKDYDKSEEVNYYLDTGMLLNDYYSKKNGLVKEENNEMSVLDFMNIKKVKTNPQQEDLINKYMSKVDENIIPDDVDHNIDICPQCNLSLTLRNIDSLLVCEKCGYTEKIIINSEKTSYKDPPRESSYFAYKRINHFNEWLAQFQAKETTDIPEEVYTGIISELKKNKFFNIDDISYKMVREILKKLKYNKYYEHIPHIINILNGKRAPVLTRQYEDQLRMMFKEIQTPFMVHCPANRKNFLSYSYVLHKFCQLLELDDLLIYFPLLKSREKLQQQDQIWEKICTSLRWEYIPSI
tara:strand:- start:134 stop:1207 length:1074 start_codon:yes stop_codon:yes gene_type:complete